MTAQHRRTDADWETDFVVELRLLDVDGRLIGDALEEVRGHCAESGESPVAAFGDPAAYARSLALPSEPARLGRVVVLSLVGLAGMQLTLSSLMSWLADEPFTLTVGLLVAAGLVMTVVLLLARHLRGVIEHPVRSLLVGALMLAGAVAAGELLTGAVARLPAPPVLAIGIAMLLGPALLEHRDAARTADPVVSPVDPAAAARTTASARRTGLLTAWLLPAATAVLAAAVWLLS